MQTKEEIVQTLLFFVSLRGSFFFGPMTAALHEPPTDSQAMLNF